MIMQKENLKNEVCEAVESYGAENVFGSSYEILDTCEDENKDGYGGICETVEENSTLEVEDGRGFTVKKLQEHSKADHAISDALKSRKGKNGNSQEKRVKALKMKDVEEQNCLLRLQAALMEVNNYIRVDGRLYWKNGFAYEPLCEGQFLAHMRATLPRSMEEDMANSSVTKVYHFIEAHPDLVSFSLGEVLEKYGDYVALQNGILDTRTQCMMANERYYKGGEEKRIICLRRIAANYVDEDEETPVWDNFLKQFSQNDEELRQRVEEVLAIALYSGFGPKKFFVLGTAPDTGKSVFGDFIEAVLADSVTSRTSPHNFARKHTLASIYDKAVDLYMDLSEAPWSAGVVNTVKILTGERRIQIEEKYKATRTVSTACKLIFGTNCPLRLKVDDAAFWNRLELVPCLYSVPERRKNPHLLSELLQEKDAIVSRCLRLLPELLRRNFELSRCEIAEEMKLQWINEGLDDVGMFLRDRCVITRNGKDMVASSELYRAFSNYMRDLGKENDLACNAFTRQVRGRIACPEKRKSARVNGEVTNVVKGIQLKHI